GDRAPAHRASGTGTTDRVALILHTSGTTARPKIVPLSQANLAASARSIARHLALEPTDRGLNVMPLFHIHGLVGSMLASIAAGASIVCTPGFDDERFFEWVARFEPTWYTAVPTIHQAVLARGEAYRRLAPAHRLRFVRSSSASLPPKVLHALETLFDAPVVEAYGMTEASHQMASNPLPPATRKPGTVGVSAGAEITILDAAGSHLPRGATGEIAIRGPGVTAGYEANPQANASAFTDGWFRTGDLGQLDEEGYLRIEGRIKEIVNRGGEKVSPREVDEALLEHEGVAQAAAFAIPHPTLGEDLAAAVVPRPGASLDEDELRGFLFGRLAEFKIPSRLLVLDAIPKGPTGKVQRTSLHKALHAHLSVAGEAPANEFERIIAGAIETVLGLDGIGREDNFFALGGDSLSGMRVIGRVNEDLGCGLRPADLFRHPTVAGLATLAGQATHEDDAARILAEIETLSDEEIDRLLAKHDAATAAKPIG
ncbi:MAG: non-ribosomal peptide synthetase, partial [Gemmatimonadales bacterium]|nr:non-ribosomal peptide synthetase [Gemmatimonadales bacterium]